MIDPNSYSIVLFYFPRLLGFIYFWVFFPFLFQMKGLFGIKGILPIQSFLKVMRFRLGKKCYFYFPTLFWFSSSDLAIVLLPIFGTVISILCMAGVFPALMLLLLFILHLSLVSAGQDFLSFGWEMFLLEIVFNTFLLTAFSAPNPIIWISLNLLLFRFHFEGGISKLLSRDKNWRNQSAVGFHYESQPIPNAIAWYAHKLPPWFQKISCALMLFTEILLPFAIFTTDEIRLVAFIGLVGLQLAIWLTGNFSYLNYMTLVFCTILLSNQFLEPLFTAPPQAANPLFIDVLLYTLGSVLIFLQLIRILTHFMRVPFLEKILYYLYPFHVANRYGIFAIMTTERYEIVFEGKSDGDGWKEYLFYYKPSELNRRPRWFSPYQPRLDWQAWFLPFTYYDNERWVQNFMYCLLAGNSDVLKLLRYNPFPEKPPKYLRAVIYLYQYTSYHEKKETGNWWKRTMQGMYSPTVSLKPNH